MKGRWSIAALGVVLTGVLVWAIAFRDDGTRPRNETRADSRTRPENGSSPDIGATPENGALPENGDLPKNEDLKPVGAGLYWVGGPQASFPFIDHAIISTEWENLEPRDDDFSGAGWDLIDESLDDYPDYEFRLRIAMGQRAPDWVKSLDGGCLGITHPESGERACVPRFWTDAYLDEYEELMAEIARRYDDEPQIRDVVNSACMTIYAEPFIRAGNDEGSNHRLWEAGLSEETYRYCLERSTHDMAKVFEHTRVSLATHLQWQIVVADGVDPSWEKERVLLEALRRELGQQLVIQNNGLGGDDGCESDEAEMWCWLAELSPPKGAQTEGDTKLELDGFTVHDAIDQALELGACFVEHNQFGDDASLARAADDQLKANC